MANKIIDIFSTIIFSVVILTTVFAVYSLGTDYISVQQKRTQSDAIDGCGEISSYTFTDVDTGVTTKEPVEQNFNRCLELKGIKK